MTRPSLRQQLAETRLHVLELTAQLAFVCGTDTPDTERKARAILIQRLARADAQRSHARKARR